MRKQLESIDPWFPGATPARQMLWLADAYAESAQVLCEALLGNELSQQYTSTRVILHLCRHATELYLKGAIGVKGGRTGKTHQLDHLYAEYLRLYPLEHSRLVVPFFAQVLAPDDGLFPGSLDEYRKTHDQRYRYPMVSSGRPFSELESFDVAEYATAVGDFRQALNTLVTRIEWPSGFEDHAL